VNVEKRSTQTNEINEKTKRMSKYEYTATMNEISGFGGIYEEKCRAMVVAGVEFCDEYVDADISYDEFQNIYGLTTNESDDCKKMQKAMLKASDDDCTGAMMQATMNHVMFIRKKGWEKYVEEMNKNEDDGNNI